MIKNLSKQQILSKDEKYLRSKWSQALGLMFSKKKKLVFIFNKEKILSIHNIFVFFSIDVLFLDSNMKVVEIKRNFKPFSFYVPKAKAKYIIELPIGIDKNTSIEDKISMKSV
jgi:uncharacterized protein